MTIVAAATTATATTTTSYATTRVTKNVFIDDDNDDAGMLHRFLARLSGRRQQQQQQQQQQHQQRHVRRPGGSSSSSSSPAAGMQQQQQQPRDHHHPAEAAVMQQPEEDQSETEPCCPRCRSRSSCSCAALGLDSYLFDREDATGTQSRSSTTTGHSSTEFLLQRVAEGTSTSGSASTTETTTTTRQRQRSGATSTSGRSCAGCEDRDVLRRRPPERTRSAATGLGLGTTLATLFLLTSFLSVADACSSRSTPKPRPPTPTPRPNITFHMYACPSNYAEWYCLNGATCFTVKIVDSLLYNCVCSNGFIGQRCEFKDLDGSYLPSRQRIMLETASIAGAVTIAVFLAVIAFISIYIHCKRKQKELRMSNGVDAVDGPARDPELRPFCSRSRSLMIFMAKHPNCGATAPSIEQTRMPNPGWAYPPESSTRVASINENKRPSQ